jgi:hypothetical protein
VCQGEEGWVCQAQCPDGGLPFACGDKDCNSGDVCLDTPPGVPQPDGGRNDYFQCVPTPKQCLGNYTCGCVTQAFQNGGNGCYPTSCSDTFGNIVVNCMGI